MATLQFRAGAWFGSLLLAGTLAACGGGATPAGPSPAQASAVASAKPAPASQRAASTAAVASSAAAKPAGSAVASGKPQASVPAIRLAYVAPVAPMLPVWMAAATKAFEKRGVNVTVRFIQANAAVPALIAKEVDALEISAAPVITADVNGKADLVFVASMLNHATFMLTAKNGINSGADLKGKTVGSDRPATPGAYGTQAALGLLGLKTTDVTIRELGSANVVLQAMLSGQLDSGTLGQPESFESEGKGFHVLQDTFGIPYQNTGIVMLRSRLDQLAPAMPGVLLALRDGMQAFNQQPDLGMKVLQEYTKTSDQNILQKTYALHRDKAPFELTLQPTLEGLKAMSATLGETIPAAKTADPAQFVDGRFLKDLPKV
ncbi:MAG TPA: ABC transporter substrate-binding protein [Chloroflexota bacterium]|nr:ABC transporter substrate-binding protein [Chloroflexota bacterium]